MVANCGDEDQEHSIYWQVSQFNFTEGDSAVNASSWFRRNHDTFWCTLK